MKINLLKLIPKGWITKDLGNQIEVWYNNERLQNNPKKRIIFYKEIMIDKKFMEGLGLFLGDGDMNRKEKGHLIFTSKDKDIANHALIFLKNKFNLKIKDISFYIWYKKENKKLKEEWSNFLRIPKDKIRIKHSHRHANECIHIQVNSVIFRKIFEIIIKKVLNKNYFNNKDLRGGLLRGLFAAEGNLGIDYLEKKDYISQIDFNLNINEKYIEKIITKILNKEKISYSIRNFKKHHSKTISIYNWKNYLKLWNNSLFDLCQRKKDKFQKICLNLNIHFNLNSNFREIFFKSLDMYQKDVAKIIGSWQGNVSKIIYGVHLLKVEQIISLLKYSNFSKKDILKNLNYVRIGCLTKLEINEDLLRFLKEFKSF